MLRKLLLVGLLTIVERGSAFITDSKAGIYARDCANLRRRSGRRRYLAQLDAEPPVLLRRVLQFPQGFPNPLV